MIAAPMNMSFLTVLLLKNAFIIVSHLPSDNTVKIHLDYSITVGCDQLFMYVRIGFVQQSKTILGGIAGYGSEYQLIVSERVY